MSTFAEDMRRDVDLLLSLTEDAVHDALGEADCD